MRRSRVHWMGQRAFLSCMAAMLLAPMISHLVNPSAEQSDNRALAAKPTMPRTLSALGEWPRQAEAYVNDHFGLRETLVRADVDVHWRILKSSPTPLIVVGRNGRIFLSDG